MNANDLDLRLLRSFLAVAHCGKVSTAAKQLHLSQPAVTAHLRRLEEIVGEPLGLDPKLAHGSFHDRPRSRAGFSPDQRESIEILGCRRRRGQALVITKRRIGAGNQNHLVFDKFFQPQPAYARTAFHKSEGICALSDRFKDDLRVINPQLDLDRRKSPGEFGEE